MKNHYQKNIYTPSFQDVFRGLTQCISQYSENDTQSIYNVDIEFGDLSDLHRPQLQLCQKATASSRMNLSISIFMHER